MYSEKMYSLFAYLSRNMIAIVPCNLCLPIPAAKQSVVHFFRGVEGTLSEELRIDHRINLGANCTTDPIR